MKLLNNIKFAFILILCATFTSCDNDDPVVCNTIAIQSGNNQAGVAGQALPEALQVLVTNASGQPVSNASVRWEVTGGGGSLSTATSTTNAEGLAVSNWTYGQSQGQVRATIDNPTQCTTSSVEFMAEPISLSLNASSTRVEPMAANTQNNCYEFNYVLGVTTNADLSNYFIDIEGEFQYETDTESEIFFATGIANEDGVTVNFQDCYRFGNDTYIDEWFTISLYSFDDIVNGEPQANAVPLVTSNRIGPIRTARPAGSPRMAAGTALPSASRAGRR